MLYGLQVGIACWSLPWSQMVRPAGLAVCSCQSGSASSDFPNSMPLDVSPRTVLSSNIPLAAPACLCLSLRGEGISAVHRELGRLRPGKTRSYENSGGRLQILHSESGGMTEKLTRDMIEAGNPVALAKRIRLKMAASGSLLWRPPPDEAWQRATSGVVSLLTSFAACAATRGLR